MTCSPKKNKGYKISTGIAGCIVRIKLDIGRKSIVELRAETDNLKMQIHKASVAMEEVLRDITGLKRSCESRDN